MINDIFVEELITCRGGVKTRLMQVGVILLAVILLIADLLFVPLVAPVTFVVICVVAFFVFRWLNTEYEYSFTNGDLDVDRISGRRWRRRMLEIGQKQIKVMAPYTQEYESEVVDYKVRGTMDFSASTRAAGRWFMIVEMGEPIPQVSRSQDPHAIRRARNKYQQGDLVFVVFQPSKRLRDAMQTYLRSRIKGNDEPAAGEAPKSSARLAAEAQAELEKTSAPAEQEQTDA